jgi:phenylacetate-coenzyme A ligase PaaK-like adenylate-forming protein
VSLPEYVVDDPGLKSLPREELRRLQDDRLRAIVDYAYATSGA